MIWTGDVLELNKKKTIIKIKTNKFLISLWLKVVYIYKCVLGLKLYTYKYYIFLIRDRVKLKFKLIILKWICFLFVFNCFCFFLR